MDGPELGRRTRQLVRDGKILICGECGTPCAYNTEDARLCGDPVDVVLDHSSAEWTCGACGASTAYEGAANFEGVFPEDDFDEDSGEEPEVFDPLANL